MSHKHEQTCTQIIDTLSTAMNAAAAHCDITLRYMEHASPDNSYFNHPESICIFSAYHSILPASEHQKAAASAELRVIALDSDISPAVQMCIVYRDSREHILPRMAYETIPLDNDIITPLGDVATSRTISAFFHAVFGTAGHDVAMQTMARYVEMEPR